MVFNRRQFLFGILCWEVKSGKYLCEALDDFYLFGDDRIPQNLFCDIVIIKTSYVMISLCWHSSQIVLWLWRALLLGMEVDDVEESGRRREFPNRWSISVRLDPGPTGHMADKPKF